MTPSPSTDEERFTTLYEATRKDVLAYLLRRASDSEQAADLLAETYLIAWHKLDRVPNGDQGALWLFGVARNLLKRQARHQHFDAALTNRLGQELEAAMTSAPPSDERWSERLRLAISKLPEKEREILLLTAWEGLTPREIAAIVGSTPNTVRVRLARARSKLRPETESHPPRYQPACRSLLWLRTGHPRQLHVNPARRGRRVSAGRSVGVRRWLLTGRGVFERFEDIFSMTFARAASASTPSSDRAWPGRSSGLRAIAFVSKRSCRRGL